MLVPSVAKMDIGPRRSAVKGVRLGRPSTLHKRAGEVLALKKKGIGLRAMSRQLEMPVSSVHSIVTGKKAKQNCGTSEGLNV
jgi:hypothetical protein